MYNNPRKSRGYKRFSRSKKMTDSQNATIIPVILSGGMGTRLWPMSRSHYPKQFLKLASDDYTLIQQTVLRVADRDLFEAPVFVSNEDHRFLVAENAQEMGIDDAAILLEPRGRNTAPALTIARSLYKATLW